MMSTTEKVPKTAIKGSIFAQKIRVPLGFIFGAVFLICSNPVLDFLIPGLTVALGGLLLRLWSAGHLRKHRQLTISGPYRYTRNPLYLGSFLMGLGFSIAASIVWIPFVFLILFLVVYIPVMKREESELLQAYGQQYRNYLETVPIFFPAIKPASAITLTGFSIQQILTNREYNAALGYLIISCFLIIKMMWS